MTLKMNPFTELSISVAGQSVFTTFSPDQTIMLYERLLQSKSYNDYKQIGRKLTVQRYIFTEDIYKYNILCAFIGGLYFRDSLCKELCYLKLKSKFPGMSLPNGITDSLNDDIVAFEEMVFRYDFSAVMLVVWLEDANSKILSKFFNRIQTKLRKLEEPIKNYRQLSTSYSEFKDYLDYDLKFTILDEFNADEAGNSNLIQKCIDKYEFCCCKESGLSSPFDILYDEMNNQFRFEIFLNGLIYARMRYKEDHPRKEIKFSDYCEAGVAVTLYLAVSGSSNARGYAKDSEEFSEILERHLPEKEVIYKVDEKVIESYNSRIRELEDLCVELKAENSKTKDLQDMLRSKQDQVNNLKATIKERNASNKMFDNSINELNALRDEVASLYNENTELKKYIETQCNNAEDDKALEEIISSFKIVVIGGHDSCTQRLYERFPNWSYVDPFKGNTADPTLIRNHDMGLIMGSYVKHKLTEKFVNEAKIYDKPIYTTYSTNVNKVIEDVYNFLNK